MQKPREDGGTGYPQRASEWLLLLEECPDDRNLHDAFTRWHNANPVNARDWAGIVQTSRTLTRLAPALRVRPATLMNRHPLPRRVWAGSMAALAACLLLFFAPGLWLELRADHLTGTGELRTVRLADGSLVRMGPHSAMAVDFTQERRIVHLLRGQGYFEVMPDPERPFQVVSSAAKATVLGTGFEVRLLEEGAEIGVRHGRVRVDTAERVQEVLGAGQQALVDAGGVRLGRAPPEQIAAWTEGELIAKNMPLAAVIDEVRPYLAGIIILYGEDLAQASLTGIYRLSDPDAALRAAVEAHGAKLRRPLPWVTVISR